jgi:AcrR family transcriptional regulator
VVASRTRLPLDRRRAQLLALGRRIFPTRSYDALSIDDLARAAGVSKGLLYHYFPSKRHFYLETVRDAAREFLRRTRPDPRWPPRERLRLSLEVYVDYLEENATGYTALLASGAGADAEVRAMLERVRGVTMQRIASTIGAGQKRRSATMLRVALRGWIGFGEGASLEWLRCRRGRRARAGGADRRALVELLATTLESVLAAALTHARRLACDRR